MSLLPKPALSSDASYLQALDTIVKDEPLVASVVSQLGSANNIRMARGICSVLDNASVKTVQDLVLGVFQQNFFDLPAPNLPSNQDDRATAVGGYIAAATIAGIPYYCKQHTTKVEAMFR
ncbi:MAG: hypothetical protein RML75_02385 [Cyanobacteriota bacterium SKYGB_h_bin112]|nr:hypothetical protein [Cyanobacteriota bacterium SKYGB_h_bin112]